ncbi:hypothetical protein [Neptuniibacter sp.]|uniref:hypothetical protein n=1 Tax=Neptuniibacter sp. TaxID=1962643 RepID=UPI00260C228D|nr:hypothetical protein [Neptuniibacter sp.]MCP4596615.1 hypothetical protein [Neptuniibacter sp.]
MIDVDVVTDVDEGYAQTVHGVTGEELECYVLGRIPEGESEVQLAEPTRHCNLPVSFTQDLGEFFFELAEEHFRCKEGDEILLLTAKVDCAGLGEDQTVSGFQQRAEASLNSGNSIVIKRRKALAAASEELTLRVRNNLYSGHRLLT